MLTRLGAAAAAGLALAGLGVPPAQAQLAEKPSVYTVQRRGESMLPAASAPSGGPGRGAPAAAAPAFVESLSSLEALRQIARVYRAGSDEPLVHTLFAIDRADGDRLYLINANRFGLHEDFIRSQFRMDRLDDKRLMSYYRSPDRRFVLGTLGHQPQIRRLAFEFWEGDHTDAALLALVRHRLGAALYEAPVFKANSMQHEAVARDAGIEVVTEVQLLGGRRYLPLNVGVAQGRLRLVERLDDEGLDDLQPDDIVVLKEVPLSLSPVAGVVTKRPSTALSHVNLLVKGWGVPNAYVRDAFTVLKPHDGHWVELRVTDTRYDVLRLGTRPPPRPVAPVQVLRAPDLRQRELLPLERIAAGGAHACGSKAVNLSRIEAWRRQQGATAAGEPAWAPVPDGFCIPFSHHAQFVAAPAARAAIAARLATPGFEQSRRVRRQALQALRADLLALPVEPALARQWVSRWQQQLRGRSVFVRSSSNSEDLLNFSGAGLYTTVPNATSADAIVQAVKAVWVSVYNTEAYEARRAAGVAESQVAMGVFVQEAVDSVASGVLVTRDPFDATHRHATWVSAKRGLGIKVVDGQRVAEQSLHDSWTGAVRRLSRSEEGSELKLDPAGGLVDRPLGEAARRDVLGDAAGRQLATAGARLKALFGGVDQDVEWAFDALGRVVVLQSRPYVERRTL